LAKIRGDMVSRTTGMRTVASLKSVKTLLADLKASIRASLRYFQTLNYKVKSIIEGRESLPNETATVGM